MRTEVTVELEEFDGCEDFQMQISRQVQCTANVRCTSGNYVTPGEFLIEDIEIDSVSRVMHRYSRKGGWHIQSIPDAAEQIDMLAHLNRELGDRDTWRDIIVKEFETQEASRPRAKHLVARKLGLAPVLQ